MWVNRGPGFSWGIRQGLRCPRFGWPWGQCIHTEHWFAKLSMHQNCLRTYQNLHSWVPVPEFLIQSVLGEIQELAFFNKFPSDVLLLVRDQPSEYSRALTAVCCFSFSRLCTNLSSTIPAGPCAPASSPPGLLLVAEQGRYQKQWAGESPSLTLP